MQEIKEFYSDIKSIPLHYKILVITIALLFFPAIRLLVYFMIKIYNLF